MKYFSGFSLKNDDIFFKEILYNTEFSVAGFSYGAIKAFKYVEDEIKAGRRVDVLQLISPAFFQTKNDKFKRLQTLSYTKSKDIYLNGFLKSCFAPYKKKSIDTKDTTIEELEELLSYVWDKQSIQKLIDFGVRVEVYLGEQDSIIDVESARTFFKNITTTTYIKGANHFLQTGE